MSDAELAVLLRAASVLIMPSRAEGFGLPVAEAMAVGTPVICSDIPALAEVAGGAAVLVPPGDPAALADALTTRARRRRRCASDSQRPDGSRDRPPSTGMRSRRGRGSSTASLD